MKTLVSIAEAKAHLEKLLERAAQGEEIVIVENGVQVGALSYATSSEPVAVVSSEPVPVPSSEPTSWSRVNRMPNP